MTMRWAIALLTCTIVAGCGDSADEQSDSVVGAASNAVVAPSVGPSIDGKVTPNEDRVATLGLLNKRNNQTVDIILKVGESRQEGKVILKLISCERTAPWETPEEAGAFVKVSIKERPKPRSDPEWREVFSGWLFKESPALNVVEHPIYDVWVKDCAMNFPGDEA